MQRRPVSPFTFSCTKGMAASSTELMSKLRWFSKRIATFFFGSLALRSFCDARRSASSCRRRAASFLSRSSLDSLTLKASVSCSHRMAAKASMISVLTTSASSRKPSASALKDSPSKPTWLKRPDGEETGIFPTMSSVTICLSTFSANRSLLSFSRRATVDGLHVFRNVELDEGDVTKLDAVVANAVPPRASAVEKGCGSAALW
mmetsp:Transcript_86830/g.243279  ORF Transcript_86830/g.243279 Transcript_86830/m.243279 type:complete len:204 (-) Transcript_86830:94-705(-)